MSAIGAIRALQERGRSVPEDVAVVGFDDQPGAAANVPPLASVDYPLSEAGRCAVEILDGIIRGGPRPPASVAVPTRLIRRRSCGCLHRDAGIDDVVGAGPGCDGSSSVVTAMVSALARAQPALPPAAVLDLCRRLESGLTESLSIHSPRPFESAVMELLQTVEAGGDRAQRWHAALTCLRRATHNRVPRSALIEAEDLFHLARVALSESADRQDSQHRLRDARQADLVSGLTVPLQSARDEGEIVALLAEHSPPLGLTPACFALYEPEAEDPVAWSRMRVLDPVTRTPSSTETRLETRCPWDERLAPSEGPRCLAVLPLVLKGHSMGFVAFEGAALAPGAAIVRQLAVALESARLQAAVREASLRDDLTGLHNRRFFTQELQREVARARRFGRTLALLLLDVDHFKAYNDTLGHRAGDEALQRIAELLRDAVPRRLDAAARYGGEEFVVLLAETDLEGARLVAERIRLAVQGSTSFRNPLTISAGIAVATGHSCDAESLLLRADTALYQAKADGRNCVRVAAAARVTEG
jgi:diguanylate cyclase (GGDEF)-like protein